MELHAFIFFCLVLCAGYAFGEFLRVVAIGVDRDNARWLRCAAWIFCALDAAWIAFVINAARNAYRSL